MRDEVWLVGMMRESRGNGRNINFMTMHSLLWGNDAVVKIAAKNSVGQLMKYINI
jgi:hypothetical protein